MSLSVFEVQEYNPNMTEKEQAAWVQKTARRFLGYAQKERCPVENIIRSTLVMSLLDMLKRGGTFDQMSVYAGLLMRAHNLVYTGMLTSHFN